VGHSTATEVWLHFCSSSPHRFPEQIVHWAPLLLKCQPSPHSSWAEGFSSPVLGYLLSSSTQIQHMVGLQTCKRFSVYSAVSVGLGLGRGLLLTACGARDVSFQGSQFPRSFEFVEVQPEFGAMSKLPS
jgi:hypothetical protein